MNLKGKGKKTKTSKKSKVPKNYSEIYKDNLLQFVKKDKSQTNENLSELIESKIKELNSPKNESEDNYLIILLFSQYFIKGNDFIKEEYFSLIDDSIYKNFNEFLMNPTEAQHQKFLESFENLDSCANIIYLICKKIVGKNPLLRDKPVDFFFKIILEEHFPELQKAFSYPIKGNQKELINTLASFIRIKYNFSHVTIKELMDLFKEEKPLDKLDNIDNLKSSIIEEDNNLSNLNREEVKNTIKEKSNNQIEKEENYSEQKPEEINEIKLEEVNSPIKQEIYNNIMNQQSNTINGNIVKTNFLSHLAKRKAEYDKMKYKTPVLDYIIKNKTKLKANFFRIAKEENIFIDHLFEYLYWLLFRINSDLINFQESKVGYFCFFDNFKKDYVEGIFSNIDLKFLYEKIISDNNFPPDDIYSPNEIIAKNAFKSRALGFEYYINNDIILNQLHAKERQRVIYIFKEVKDIEGLKSENIKIEGNNRALETYSLEVDGVILEKENENIILDRSFFIPDPINKFRISDNPGTKTIINYKKKNENYQEDKDDIFYLDKNSLCIIEIKNQFPPYKPEENNKEIYINVKKKYPIDFYNMVKSLVKKSLVFKDMFEQFNEKVDSIKLILLYDAKYKFNYVKEIVKAMNDIFSIKNKELIEMIEFQCIYIKSSYIAGGFYNFKSEQKKMEIKMQEMKEQLKKEDKEIQEIKDKMNNMDSSMKDWISKVEKLKDQIKDIKGDVDKEKEQEKEAIKTIVNKLPEKTEKEAQNSVTTQSKDNLGEGNGKE